MERFFGIVPRERLYDRTGIQFLPFNSVFQLQALRENNTALLNAADRFLMMPDLFTYFLSGAKINEATIASTSQLLDPDSRPGRPTSSKRSGSGFPLQRSARSRAGRRDASAGSGQGDGAAADPRRGRGQPRHRFGRGRRSGRRRRLGLHQLGHVVAHRHRGRGPDHQRREPAPDFTNEGGVGGTIRFLKNVTGLWLVQQCRRKWNADRSMSYEDMRVLSESAPPFGAFIDPDAPDFANPEDMPAAIRAIAAGPDKRCPRRPPRSPAAPSKAGPQVPPGPRRSAPPLAPTHPDAPCDRRRQPPCPALPIHGRCGQDPRRGRTGRSHRPGQHHGQAVASATEDRSAPCARGRFLVHARTLRAPRHRSLGRAYERFAEIIGRNP